MYGLERQSKGNTWIAWPPEAADLVAWVTGVYSRAFTERESPSQVP